MYAKLENNKLIYAPINLKVGDKLILNFNKNVELMQQYGYKEVVDIKQAYDSNTHYLTVGGYTEDENSITVSYELNEIVINNEPTLEERVAELERINQEQQLMIQQLLLLNEVSQQD